MRPSPMKLGPSEYPSREDALAVITALAKRQAATWSELETLSGVPNVYSFVERAFHVYGYPELEAVAVTNALNSVFFTPSSDAPLVPEAEPFVSPQVNTYGFTPRSVNRWT